VNMFVCKILFDHSYYAPSAYSGRRCTSAIGGWDTFFWPTSFFSLAGHQNEERIWWPCFCILCMHLRPCISLIIYSSFDSLMLFTQCIVSIPLKQYKKCMSCREVKYCLVVAAQTELPAGSERYIPLYM
jgi:hypothetical protein